MTHRSSREVAILLLVLAAPAVRCAATIAEPAETAPDTTVAGAGGQAGSLIAEPPTSPRTDLAAPAAGGSAGAPAPETNAPSPAEVPDGLTIPTARPRLWWTADRLARAKSWFAAHPFTPRDDAPDEQAFHYLMTGTAASCRAAIDHALGVTFSTSGVASDDARWEGENVILAYDWCHDVMTDGERRTLLDRWNGFIEALDAKPWGGPGMEGNNYYIGYLRNALEWAMATWGENPRAQAILQHALVTRWKASFLPYAETAGAGGVPHEGSQYGRGVMFYWTVPLVTAGLYGRNMWDETRTFRDSVYYLIYSLPPGDSTLARNPDERRAETFPFNEDERWLDGGTGARTLGSYLVPLVEQWASSPIAGYIQRYLDVTGATPANKFIAATATTVPARDFHALPLDYWAPGIQFFYTKNSWDPTATAVNLQLGTPAGVGHEHLDAGSFQIWRAGRWLSRETVGYTDTIVGWNNGAPVDCRAPVGHNAVTFNGKGVIDLRVGAPKTLRLESKADHSFAAVDLTPAMTIQPDEDLARSGNPFAAGAIREFLFVRPLDALVVFDRMQAANGAMPAASVTKTFITHFEQAPVVESNSVLGVDGDEALRLTTMVPARPSFRVIAEGGAVGQHRVELDTSGSAQSHFLNVLHARDASAEDLRTSMKETADGYELTLTHPAKGTAVVTFRKGMQSTGGSFGFSATGTPVPAALGTGVQTQAITDAGPVWR